jgi:hypothetical protein
VTGERNDQGFVEGVKKIHKSWLEGKPILEDCFAQSLGLVGDGMVGVGGRGLGKKAAVEHKKNVAVDKSIKDYTQKDGQEPSCSRSVVKDNLNDAVESAKENKALIQTEKKKGTGPVQCNTYSFLASFLEYVFLAPLRDAWSKIVLVTTEPKRRILF